MGIIQTGFYKVNTEPVRMGMILAGKWALCSRPGPEAVGVVSEPGLNNHLLLNHHKDVYSKKHMHIKYNPSYRNKMMFIFVGKYMNLILF